MEEVMYQTLEEFNKLPKDKQTGCVQWFNGTKEWYKEGKLHREDGPAVEYADGTKEWYKDDELHRLEGPAVEFTNGNKEWYKEDLLHRLDGPAVEYENGDKVYYLDGVRCSYTEWYAIVNDLEKFI